MGVFVLIIVYFKLLLLFPLSKIVVNLLIALRHKHNKLIIDIPGGCPRADRLDIEFNQAPFTSNELQRVKLYDMVTLP